MPRLAEVRRERARSRGVTLIELMIVVAISGVLVGLATPELRRLVVNGREQAALLAVRQQLEEAGSLARSLMTPVILSVNGGSIYIETVLQPTRKYQPGPEVSGITINTSSGQLLFNAQGGLDERDPVNVTVRGTSGRQYTYVIYPAIGAVRKR